MTEVVAGGGRSWRRNPGLRIGSITALAFLLVGFVSLVWTPHPIGGIDVGGALQGPGAVHWFGTDHLGRDVLSLMMKGILTSFITAAIAVVIGALIGVPLGLAAAIWGGPTAWAVGRLGDFLFTFPALIAAILITSVSGPSTANVMIAVGIFNIAVFARAAHGGAVSFKGLDYVAAGGLAGMNGLEIARRYVLPGLFGVLVAQAVLQLAVGVIAEAGLSYVGLGAQTPATSLGLMLRDAQSYALTQPSLMVLPGLAIMLVAFSLNIAGEGLRERLNPLLRRSVGGSHGAA